jgi:outer membrane receptor protein involved in Fe transport
MAAIDRSSIEGRFDLRPGDRHEILVGISSYDESQDDGRAAYDVDGSIDLGRNVWERERVDLRRDQYDASYTLHFDDGSNLTAGLYYAERDTAIDEEQGAFTEIFIPSYDIGEERTHTSIGWFRPLGSRVTLRAGASRHRQDWSVYDQDFIQLNSLPPDFLFEERMTEDGVWIEPQISFGGRVDLTLGLRWIDYTYEDNESRARWLDYDLPEDSAILPRASLTWKPVNPLSLRFSVGRGLRQPPGTYDSVCCGRQFRGNRGIRMERSTVLGVETTWQPSPSMQFTASVFQSDFEEHVISLVSWAERFVPVYQNANVPSARYRDLSVEARVDPAPWVAIRASASWIDAENRTPGDSIPVLLDYYGTPVSRPLTSEEIPYVPDRNASLSVVFRVPRHGLAFDLSAQHTGPRLIQRLVQFPYELPVFTGTPSFEVYNFRASKTIESGFEIFVGVDNIGDYIQKDLADPTTDYTWGPLRGTYVYGGVTFRLAHER